MGIEQPPADKQITGAMAQTKEVVLRRGYFLKRGKNEFIQGTGQRLEVTHEELSEFPQFFERVPKVKKPDGDKPNKNK